MMTLLNVFNLPCIAADFDGSTFVRRTGTFSGITDSKVGIVSAWFRLDGGDGTSLPIIDTSSPFALQVFRVTDNTMLVKIRDASLAILANVQTVATYVAGATWFHILSSWDLTNSAKCNIYMNDVSDFSITSYTDGTPAYSVEPAWAISGGASGASRFNGCLAEIYFAPGQYLDFTVAANRRKFISAQGKPVDLGATGSTPTGIAPIMFSHLSDGEVLTNIAVNRGTGGDFGTISGTLGVASSSPSS